MSAACTQAARTRGFSLIEALIALAIVAGMSGVLAEIVQSNARTQAEVRVRREALLLAQSALDASYDRAAPEAGSWGGYSWRIERQIAGQSDPLDRQPIERLRVAVSFGDREVVTLATSRTRP